MIPVGSVSQLSDSPSLNMTECPALPEFIWWHNSFVCHHSCCLVLPAAADFLCCLPGCSQQQQGALGCSPGPDMCSLHMSSCCCLVLPAAAVFSAACWLLPAAAVSLLLSGYHQQQQWASGCSPWPCFFFPPISSLRFPPCCPNGGGESPFYRYNYRQCL